jgi:LysM repeat protein
LKINTPDDEREFMSDQEQSKSPDAAEPADRYSEEMARSAARSLFDDEDDISAEEARPYVSGFEKAAPERAPGHIAVHSDRSGPSKPRVRVAEDRLQEEGFEREEGEAPYPRRERVRMTPPPKPAVKVNVASPRTAEGKMPHNPKVRAVSHQREVPPRETPPLDLPQDEEDIMDDEYNTFRQRYKNRESVPSSRYKEQARGSRSARSAAPNPEKEYGSYDEDPVSPARWIAFAVAFVFLIVSAVLGFQVVTKNGQLEEANAKIAELEKAQTDSSAKDIALEKASEELQDANNTITDLQARLANQPTPAGDEEPLEAEEPTGPISRPGEDDPVAPPEPTSAPSSTYTVQSGDNLTKISNYFYGSAGPANIEKIMNANGLVNSNLQIGQVLIIP